MSALIERFHTVCARLTAATTRSGRKPDSVRLVAVSKLHSADAVAELARHWHSLSDLNGGLTSAQTAGMQTAGAFGNCKSSGTPIFGESYTQEATAKMSEVAQLLASAGAAQPPALKLSEKETPLVPQWHFIGHIQSRKAKEVTGAYSLIHSVDSIKLAQQLQKSLTMPQETAMPLQKSLTMPQDILLQVNIGLEPQKSGILPENLEALLLATAALPNLRVCGLMCMAPLVETDGEARPYFNALRCLRDTVQANTGFALPELSMGMSHDCEAAIAEGATLVRIGTDIFGSRQ